MKALNKQELADILKQLEDLQKEMMESRVKDILDEYREGEN